LKSGYLCWQLSAAIPVHPINLCCSTLQERFNNPLWHDVDKLATYLEHAFVYLQDLRKDEPTQQHAKANKAVSTGAAFLIIFTTSCALMYGTAHHMEN
jgi:hypothetical protein